jgi:hypothetical protein
MITDSMKLQTLIQRLIDQLSVEDIADGCYSGLPITCKDSSGRIFTIVGVETDHIGTHLMISEA